MTWNDHVDMISKKIIKSAGLITRIRHFINLNSLKLIYYLDLYMGKSIKKNVIDVCEPQGQSRFLDNYPNMTIVIPL